MSFVIKQAGLREIETALGWAKAEGWNPGLADAASFYAADASGFFVGEWEGRMVASIAAVKYGEAFAFVGLYIVQPEFRGRGLGLATWERAMASLGGRNVGLDGVIERQAAYSKSGFTTVHRNVRYGGRVRSMGREAGAGRSTIPAEAWGVLSEFDRRFFPAERASFLKAWLAQPGVETCFDERDGKICGYGVMRRCHEGRKIGPLFAIDAVAARRVLEELLSRVGDEPVFLDVPEDNAAAVALARGAGLAPVFETARMYTRGRPTDVDWAGVYGVTTFELG